jgi:general secretion pathway protein N
MIRRAADALGAILTAIALAGATLSLVAAAAAGDMPALKDLSATRERPLFDPSRRPPSPPPPPPAPAEPTKEAAAEPMPPAAPTMPPPTAKLTGVIIGGRTSLAIFHEATGSKSVSLKVGGDLEGWTLVEIESRKVVVEHEGERVEMELKTAEQSGGGATPGGGTDDGDMLDQ